MKRREKKGERSKKRGPKESLYSKPGLAVIDCIYRTQSHWLKLFFSQPMSCFLTFTLPILFCIPPWGGLSEQLCGAWLPAGVKLWHGVQEIVSCECLVHDFFNRIPNQNKRTSKIRKYKTPTYWHFVLLGYELTCWKLCTYLKYVFGVSSSSKNYNIDQYLL